MRPWRHLVAGVAAWLGMLLAGSPAVAHPLSFTPAQGAYDIAFVFPGAPANPGIRMLELHRAADGSVSGWVTSDWYGRMPMQQIVVTPTLLSFDLRNLNTPGVPIRHWRAQVRGQNVTLDGGIWDSTVALTGHRATAAERTALTFHETTLPALGTLAPDGLALTPPMGWSSWNKFADKIDDATIRAIADAMVSTGLRDAGYTYVNIDDGWQGVRGADGQIRPNAKFPDMKALADYVHARGLKFGLYSSPGPRTCAGYEGSYGHVRQDAQTFADWGVDYLKYDLCSGEYFYADADTVQRSYYEMGAALRATGRPIVYSLCEYGRFRVGSWGRAVGGHLWRTTGDITDDYATMARIGFEKNGNPSDAGPGEWNDPDMLEIGNGGMSEAAYRSHMTLWAMSAAPLMMGHDVRTTSAAAKRLLEDRAVIAIDQDARGVQGKPVRKQGTSEIWLKPLAGGAYAIAVFNRADAPVTLTLRPADIGLDSFTAMRDVWKGGALDPQVSTFTVPANDVVLLHVRG
ncbi:glycoside hydrolase family 27 protein [Sphingomonas echinoides]|uniref:Alpha-galactosidase n=1 Tax=Sphingomonas echinoides TaxID=59803 RepID=A0ABU4PLX5_9SPHN|nr:glycoside hydrolase family 27 protein [Sphingomonas echinoides]MDX5985188.1 glycoside hydrolase family 27 protein [Sphingomonas echinoides]